MRKCEFEDCILCGRPTTPFSDNSGARCLNCNDFATNSKKTFRRNGET